MLELKTDRQCILIVNNVVAACKDINKLNKTGYDFINIASGFIAHYNLHGFIDAYNRRSLRADALDVYDRHSLRADILFNKANNQYDNFHPGEENYEYYMQKKQIYNAICEMIEEG